MTQSAEAKRPATIGLPNRPPTQSPPRWWEGQKITPPRVRGARPYRRQPITVSRRVHDTLPPCGGGPGWGNSGQVNGHKPGQPPGLLRDSSRRHPCNLASFAAAIPPIISLKALLPQYLSVPHWLCFVDSSSRGLLDLNAHASRTSCRDHPPTTLPSDAVRANALPWQFGFVRPRDPAHHRTQSIAVKGHGSSALGLFRRTEIVVSRSRKPQCASRQ